MRFGILGPLEVWDGARAVGVGGPQQRALLAVLLVHSGRTVSVDRLIDYLWGDDPPATARSLLQGCVAGLRRSLATADHQPVQTRPRGYTLVLRSQDDLDLARFRRLVAQARAARSAQEAVALLAQALAVWRGPALEDVGCEPLRPEISQLDEQRLAVIEERAELELGLGLDSDAVAPLRALVREHPLREGLWRRLIVALYRTGRQAEALAAYRELRERLVDELGVEPSPAVRELHRAVLAGEALTVTAPEPPSGDTGAERTAPTPAQLPAAVHGFTGRSGQLALLDEALSGGGGVPAVAVLTGTAGVGKTALAVQWAHRVRDRFPGGQLYLDLRGHSPKPSLQPLDALAVLLDGLGVPAEQVPVDVDRAAALYRSMLDSRRVLVVLDNAAGAEQVRPLLPGSRGCAVLVTSRDQLTGLVAREGAHRISVDVLSEPEARDLLSRLVGQRRANTEPDAVAELAGLCAYLPLALRIAAADVGDSIAERVSDLASGDRLGELEVEGDPSSAVRAAFDLSYTALDAGSRRLFRLLGIVPGADIDVPAAAAAGDVPVREAQQLLRRLRRAHLVQSAAGRYTCHDLLCLYAGQRAHAEDPPTQRRAAIDRLLRWWLGRATAAARVLNPEMLRLPDGDRLPLGPGAPVVAPFADRIEASAWLDAERANLVAAVRHAAEHGPREVAWRLSDALRGYFWLRMYGTDWLAVASSALACAELDGDLAGQAAAHLSLGDAHGRQGRYDHAIEHYSAALRLNRRLGRLDGESAALGSLGNVYWWSGRMPEAADHYHRALQLARRSGRVAGQAVNLGNLGAVYWELGRLDLAVQHHEEALDIDRRIGAHLSEAVDLCNLGKVDVELGELPRALDRLERALTLHREIGDRGGQAETLRILALAHRAAGRQERALELALAAADLAAETGDVRWEADALNTVGHCLTALGRPVQAIERHRAALDLARATSIRYPEIVALMSLGEALPDVGGAVAAAAEAVELARRSGHRLLEGHALVALGRAHSRAGDAAAAQACWGEALDVLKSTGSAATHRVHDLLDAGGNPAYRV